MDYRYNFNQKDKKKTKKIIFVIIVIILTIIGSSLFFRNSQNKTVSTIAGMVSKPIELISGTTKNIGTSISSYFANNKKINEEKEKIENEKKELEYQLLESKRVLDENESLKKMLEISKKFQHFDIKLGRIIYREHDNWTQTFKIDIGKNDGISLNQAVVHQEGLVGYISEVEDNSATVTTILDPSSSVSVNISTINEPAILQGDLSLKSNNKLKLNFIPIDAEVSISDMLYTSGLGSTYPNAIPVGKISEVVNDKNDTNRYAIVEPNVNIRTITEVGIIIN